MNITSKKPENNKDAARSVDSRSSRDEPKVDDREIYIHRVTSCQK